MIPIFIPVDKNDIMSIDILEFSNMFPRWYCIWLGIFSIGCVLSLWSLILFEEVFNGLILKLSFGNLVASDLLFFPAIYVMSHIFAIYFEMDKLWKQILVLSTTNIIAISCYIVSYHFVY